MKKILLGLCLLATMSSALLAKGGCGPFLASCCIGPRVGLEMNEGTDIRSTEWIGFVSNLVITPVGNIVYGFDPATGKSMNEVRGKENLGGPAIKAQAPKNKGGLGPFLAGFCLGPRVGLELNDGRKIRTMEWLTLVPVVQIIPMTLIAIEAGSGKTMAEVAAAEKLDK